jgi:putative acyl-CoA dehydrogenase
VRSGAAEVADAFCAGRLGEARGRAFGTLPAGVDGDAIVARTLAV